MCRIVPVKKQMLHPYQVFIDSSDTAKIREVYNYEWTNEEL